MVEYTYRVLCCLLWLVCVTCVSQTREEVYLEIKKQNIPHAKIVYAQARLESGNFKSTFYKKTNNMFGLKRKGKYARYSNWKESVTDYKKRISSRYKGGNYYAFLEKIGYAKDKRYIEKVKQIANHK